MDENNKNNRINLEFTIESEEEVIPPSEAPAETGSNSFNLEFDTNNEPPVVTDVNVVFASVEEEQTEELTLEAPIENEVHREAEFQFPDSFSFTVEEPENMELAPNVTRTYMPTFSDTVPSIPIVEEAEVNTVNNASQSSSTRVFVESVTARDADPTEEIEEVISDVSIVNVNAPSSETYDTHTTVFKFEDKPTAVAEENEPSIEELAYLLEDNEPQVAEELPREEYTIPDPSDIGNIAPQGLVPTQPTTAPVPLTVVGDDGAERGKLESNDYSAPSQRELFKDNFLDGLMAVRVRLIAALIILVGAVFVENAWLFGMDIPALLALPDFHGNMALLDLHFVLAIFAIALPEAIRGIINIIKGKVLPELIITTSLVVTVFYTVTATVYAGAGKYPLFGTLFGISAVSTILATYFKRSADFTSFKLVSSSADKKIVERKLTRSLVDENRAVDGKVEEYKSKLARVFSAGFVKDFFKRSKSSKENSKNSLIILLSALGLSFVSAVVAFFVSGMNIFTMAMIFAGVFLLGVPTFSLLSHKIPLFHFSTKAIYENCTLIGEESIIDYAGVDVLTFVDTEVFTEEDVSLQRIVSYESSENIEKSMRQFASIFSVVGGPLENIFLTAISYTPPVATDIEIEADGIRANVSGKEVRVGSYEYMTRHGVIIPDGVSREASSLTTRIMYSSEEGVMCAKLYLRYTLSEEFTMLMPMLLEEGITPLVYSRDPNVTNELFRSLMAGADNVRVLKRVNLENPEKTVYNRASAGFVTTGDKVNVINTLILAKKYSRIQSRIAMTELTSSAVGLGLGIVLALTKMFVVPSIILGAWQLAWCIALYRMSKGAIDIPDEEGKPTE